MRGLGRKEVEYAHVKECTCRARVFLYLQRVLCSHVLFHWLKSVTQFHLHMLLESTHCTAYGTIALFCSLTVTPVKLVSAKWLKMLSRITLLVYVKFCREKLGPSSSDAAAAAA